MAKKRWFISHASGAAHHTPMFFKAVNKFAEGERGLTMILPHQEYEMIDKTKEDIEAADLVLAEISIASTGSGIELGWASAARKPVIAFHQGASVISPSIQFVADAIHVYITEEDIIKVLKTL